MSQSVDNIIVEIMGNPPTQLRTQQMIVEVMGRTDGDYSFNNAYSSAFNVLPPNIGLVNSLTAVEVLAPTNLPGRLTNLATYVEVMGKASGVLLAQQVKVEVMGKAVPRSETLYMVLEVLGEKQNLCNGTL